MARTTDASEAAVAVVTEVDLRAPAESCAEIALEAVDLGGRSRTSTRTPPLYFSVGAPTSVITKFTTMMTRNNEATAVPSTSERHELAAAIMHAVVAEQCVPSASSVDQIRSINKELQAMHAFSMLTRRVLRRVPQLCAGSSAIVGTHEEHAIHHHKCSCIHAWPDLTSTRVDSLLTSFTKCPNRELICVQITRTSAQLLARPAEGPDIRLQHPKRCLLRRCVQPHHAFSPHPSPLSSSTQPN